MLFIVKENLSKVYFMENEQSGRKKENKSINSHINEVFIVFLFNLCFRKSSASTYSMFKLNRILTPSKNLEKKNYPKR